MRKEFTLMGKKEVKGLESRIWEYLTDYLKDAPTTLMFDGVSVFDTGRIATADDIESYIRAARDIISQINFIQNNMKEEDPAFVIIDLSAENGAGLSINVGGGCPAFGMGNKYTNTVGTESILANLFTDLSVEQYPEDF